MHFPAIGHTKNESEFFRFECLDLWTILSFSSSNSWFDRMRFASGVARYCKIWPWRTVPRCHPFWSQGFKLRTCYINFAVEAECFRCYVAAEVRLRPTRRPSMVEQTLFTCDVSKIWRCICSKKIIFTKCQHFELVICSYSPALSVYVSLSWFSLLTFFFHWIFQVAAEAEAMRPFPSVDTVPFCVCQLKPTQAIGLCRWQLDWGGGLSKEWKNKTVASLWKLTWSNISIRPGSIWQPSLTLNSSSCWNLWRCRWIWSALPRLDPCRSAAPAGRAENLGLARNDKYILSYIILIHLSCTTHFQTVMLTSCKKMSLSLSFASCKLFLGNVHAQEDDGPENSLVPGPNGWQFSKTKCPNVSKAETSAAAKSSERG